MKLFKTILILAILTAFVSCREDKILFPEERADASIFINSEPVGASIFYSNEFTNKITPDWLLHMAPGNHLLTLKYEGYADTTIYVTLSSSRTEYLSIQMRKEE